MKHKTLIIIIMLLLGVGIYLLSTTRKQVIPDKEDLVQVYVNTRKGDVAIFKRVYMNAELFNVQLALDDGTFISCRNYMPLRDAVTINMD